MRPAPGSGGSNHRRVRWLAIASLLAIASNGALPRESDDGPAPPEAPFLDEGLTDLLDRMDRAASLYRQAALKFSCRETIRPDKGRTLRFDYLYVTAEDGTFLDYRTRIGDATEITPLTIPVKPSLLRAYSWVFLFERGFRPHVRYRILGTGEAMGREAILVGFEPIPPIRREINDWIGTAWVEPLSGRIVRVEAKGAIDLQALRAAEATLPPAWAARRRFPVRSVTTEFGIERNGMLLPSQAVVEIEEHLVPGRNGRPSSSRVTYRTIQRYEDYKFFGVTAEEKHPDP